MRCRLAPHTQVQEREPFICELLGSLTDTIQDLQPHQIHTFYEAVGLMIGAESDPVKRDDYLHRLMGPPNSTWAQILAQARSNTEVLKQQEVIRSIQNVLQTNVSVCTSLGQPFLVQFNVIFADMLQVRPQPSRAPPHGDGCWTPGPGAERAQDASFVPWLSECVPSALPRSTACTASSSARPSRRGAPTLHGAGHTGAQGRGSRRQRRGRPIRSVCFRTPLLTPSRPRPLCPPLAPRSTQIVKYMRSVKKVALKLIETFVDKTDDPALLARYCGGGEPGGGPRRVTYTPAHPCPLSQYVPAMMDPLLGDYARSVPDAR